MRREITMTLHPEILTRNGKKQFAVLPYEEFVALQEWLADMEDLLELRKAKRAEGKKRSIPSREAKRQLGLA
jgi:PHD/YefM family antitoxin component YafN of YafNO toxin-antitoxin module